MKLPQNQSTRPQKRFMKLQLYCCFYPTCNKEYTKKYNLKRHIQTVHLNLRKFFCGDCGDSFTTKQSCQEHQYLHLQQKLFECHICNRKFNQINQLRMHSRTHVRQVSNNEIENSDSMKTFKPEMQVDQKVEVDNLIDSIPLCPTNTDIYLPPVNVCRMIQELPRFEHFDRRAPMFSTFLANNQS